MVTYIWHTAQDYDVSSNGVQYVLSWSQSFHENPYVHYMRTIL